MTAENLQYHPAAVMFPMLREEDLAELASDIGSNGLIEPITLYEGMILVSGFNFRLRCPRMHAEEKCDGSYS
jgi:hypothetical protein